MRFEAMLRSAVSSSVSDGRAAGDFPDGLESSELVGVFVAEVGGDVDAGVGKDGVGRIEAAVIGSPFEWPTN
jgi:hypothetical protein